MNVVRPGSVATVLLGAVRRYLSRLLLSLVSLMHGYVHFVSASAVDFQRQEGVIEKREVDWSYFARQWEKAIQLKNEGHYWRGVHLQESILEEALELSGCDPKTHSPALVSSVYVTNIGHLGMLSFRQALLENGHIPQASKSVLHPGYSGNSVIAATLGRKVEYVPSFSSTPFLRSWEWPSFWSLVEPFGMLRTDTGFRDWHQVWESYSATGGFATGANPLLALSDRYCQMARRRLEELGLPRGAWFVGLMVRESDSTRDVRFSPLPSYQEAVLAVAQAGGWTVRFGVKQTASIRDWPNVIDLSTLTPRDNRLDPYVLANCRFFIGSNSGTSPMSTVLGTPSLITNIIAIGRNTLSGYGCSLYLPKQVLSSRQEPMSFREILGSPLAFWEDNSVMSYETRKRFQPNTSRQIALATQEMLRRVDGDVSDAAQYESEVASIRHEMNAVSCGTLAGTYINDHPTFLD